MQYDDNIDPYRFLYFSVVHYMLAEDILHVVKVFNCESSSSTSYQMFVYKVEIYHLKVHQPIRAQFETNDQSENSILDQLYQLKSAVKFRPSKYKVLSLSTSFHFRYHNLIK